MKPVIADWLTQPGGIVERLVALRTRAGLRAMDLADRLSWQRSKVSKLENGKQLPSLDDVRQWAEHVARATRPTSWSTFSARSSR